MTARRWVLALALWGTGLRPAQGQEGPAPTPAVPGPVAASWLQELPAAQEAPQDDGWTFLGTAKWASLAISGGAALYGFSLNSQADEIFERLDQICLDDPERCRDRNPDGSFSEAGLEELYQQTLAKDRQARAALLVSQVTLAASVLFFIMDLSNRPPDNIPFDPPPITLEVAAGPDGRVRVGARIPVGGAGQPTR